MNRRGFLGLLGLAAAAPVVSSLGDKAEVSPVGDGVALNNVADEDWAVYDPFEHTLAEVQVVNNSSRCVTLVARTSDSSVPLYEYVVAPGQRVTASPDAGRVTRIKLRLRKDGQFFPDVYVRQAYRRDVTVHVSTWRGNRHEVYTYNYATRKRAMYLQGVRHGPVPEPA